MNFCIASFLPNTDTLKELYSGLRPRPRCDEPRPTYSSPFRSRRIFSRQLRMESALLLNVGYPI